MPARPCATFTLFAAVGLSAPYSALAADLPLTSLTLYRSGVGYFEHAGTVTGNETVSLRFEADRINDILKSMVLLDFGGGTITGAEYEPNEPLSRRLEDFRINPLGAQSPIKLLQQLQGVKVRIRTSSGDMTGVVLGVTTQQTPISVGDKTTIINDTAVSLLTDRGVSSVTQTDIRSVEILDPDLADELQRALATIAQHRDDRWTTINLGFSGKKERKALVAYTHEAPVWKTSYRLILPDDTDGSPTIQGWAIVENDTNEDWSNVRLTLASGRPVSFVMDLQTPLILRRPIVPVPMIASLGPQMYEGGIGSGRVQAPAQVSELDGSAQFQTKRARKAAAAENFNQTEDRAAGATIRARVITSDDLINNSAAAAASGGDVGKQFLYTFDSPVSIARGKSSMLPILSRPIEGHRLSIYSWKGKDSRPLLGVKLTNNTGLHLMPGPIAVYDGGAYAGDAQIQHVSRGAERLLSYAVDFDLDAHREQSQTEEITKIRISKGLIVRTHSSRRTTTYTFTNNDDEKRMVLIEHPKIPGWKILGETTPHEETDSLYRFELPIATGETQDLDVIVERVWAQQIAITSMNIAQLRVYTRDGVASQAVLDAVSHAAEIQSRINSLQARLNQLHNDTSQISTEQNRIRENMRTIEHRSDLYTRYMKKLNKQETRLEAIDSERADVQRQLDVAQKELNDFLKDLEVD